MKRLRLHLTIGLWVALSSVLLGAANKPNVVILFADDSGYADFGFQESAREDFKHLTPHIDSIASAGARFTNAYVTGAVCSPSRAGMMTGRYQERFGHETTFPQIHKMVCHSLKPLE